MKIEQDYVVMFYTKTLNAETNLLSYKSKIHSKHLTMSNAQKTLKDCLVAEISAANVDDAMKLAPFVKEYEDNFNFYTFGLPDKWYYEIIQQDDIYSLQKYKEHYSKLLISKLRKDIDKYKHKIVLEVFANGFKENLGEYEEKLLEQKYSGIILSDRKKYNQNYSYFLFEIKPRLNQFRDWAASLHNNSPELLALHKNK